MGFLLLFVCCMGKVRPFAEGFEWLVSHPLERFYLLPAGWAGAAWFVVFGEERARARKRGRLSAAGLIRLLALGLCTAFFVFGLLTGFCAPEIFKDGRIQTALMTAFSCLLFYSGFRVYYRSVVLRRREKRPAAAWDRVCALLGAGAMALAALLFLFLVWLLFSVVLYQL
ncbi:MAG: hypothetical protein HFE86_01110 [Clostridiales bacterium]|nr:hypothetical protein [Clostridiales bacterium]